MIPFKDSLSFCSPAHGGFGIIRAAAAVPESRQLFICPAACFRHGSLGAIEHGYKNRLAYCAITQAEIAQGYDRVIAEGIEEYLRRLPTPPKVLFVYVSCLDDFIGTDLEAILKRAAKQHPDILFQAGHMNPIASSTKRPPLVTTLDAMTNVLPTWEEQNRDEGITLFGNILPIPDTNELVRILTEKGRPVRQIGNCRDFAQYCELTRSSSCIITRSFYAYAVSRLQQKMAMPSCSMPVSYDIEEVAAQYETLSEFLGMDLAKETRKDREKAEQEIAETVRLFAGLPVYVSDSATFTPCSMALALRSYGFCVPRVYTQELAGKEKEAAAKLEALGTSIVQADDPSQHDAFGGSALAAAIGEEAAYLSGARYAVDLSEDDRMCGYGGIRSLMRMLRESLQAPADLRTMIEEYGGVI
ncbi:MAG: nitrogenase component 1 [Lachnospiraceae bacterium]